VTGEETLSIEARLIADLGVQVDRLTRQVMFRDMIITELKHEVKAERAAAVAWLRRYDANVYPSWLPEADAIERGEHRKEKA